MTNGSKETSSQLSEALSDLSGEEKTGDEALARAEEDKKRTIEDARVEAQAIMEKARRQAEKEREEVLAKKQKQVDAKREKILADARAEAKETEKKSTKGLTQKLLPIIFK